MCVDAMSVINEQPTVEAVEVIRCQGCRYYKEYMDPHGVNMTECGYGAPFWKEPNGYCHRAKRKERD